MRNRAEMFRLPAMAARRVYEQEACARSFEEDLEAHLLKGWVISTPAFFVMARPVPLAVGWPAILDPWICWHPGECDCWHIWLAAGSMRALVEAVPFPLPWVSFERDNRPRCARFESLRRRILALNPGHSNTQ